MKKDEVIALLEKNKNERGMAHWERIGIKGLSSFGMGLTQLKKLAKGIGKDHELAQELWNTTIYDARTMSILIEEPRKVSREQVEEQVKELEFWGFCHVYSSVLLSKVPFQQELCDEWRDSKDDVKRRCSYQMLYNLAKDNKKLPDSYFEPIVDRIEKDLQNEENFVKDAMNASLLFVGQRSPALHKRVVEAAKNIGKVEVDYGDNSCVAPDVLKHLTNGRLKEKMKA